MFDFIDDIRELKDIVMTFRYINYSNKYVIFEGTKDILFFDDKSIILKLKNGEIKVNGSNLMVCEIDSNYLAIKGNITSIESVGLL